jgi:hypothetical protein
MTTSSGLNILFGVIAGIYSLALLFILLTAWLMFGGGGTANGYFLSVLISIPGYLALYILSLSKCVAAKHANADAEVRLRWALLPLIGIAWTGVSCLLWLGLCNGSFTQCGAM